MNKMTYAIEVYCSNKPFDANKEFNKIWRLCRTYMLDQREQCSLEFSKAKKKEQKEGLVLKIGDVNESLANNLANCIINDGDSRYTAKVVQQIFFPHIPKELTATGIGRKNPELN